MIRELVPTMRRRLPLDRFEREFEHLFQRFFTPEMGWLTGRETWVPKINVAETENEFEVTMDLPGMKPEEFTIEVKDGALCIGGHRKQEETKEGKDFHRVERRYGEFRRVIELPVTVDEERISAEYRDGVLRVCVPKREESKPKRIEVTGT